MKPRKIILILMVMITGLISLQAQSEDQWSIGPRGGVNFANVTNVDESESITGTVLGVTSTYSFNQNTGLTLEALYSVEGYQAPFTEVKLRYLQIPVYFDYFFGDLGERFRPKIYAGVSPGFYLSGTVNELENNDDYYNKFMFALTGGLGFNYRVGTRIWLNTDLRSFIGLSDIRDADISEGEAIYPRNVQLSLGLCYGFGKL